MKASSSNTKARVRAPAAAALKTKKDAMERGERTPSRVFRIEKRADGTFSRIAVNPETQRRKSAKAWEAKSEVAKVRQSLDLTQESFADLLGVGLSTLRSWEQNKRQPSGAARMLITIALKHPEVLQEAV
jgi:DNA-binding transcriptional regulator YiaG